MTNQNPSHKPNKSDPNQNIPSDFIGPDQNNMGSSQDFPQMSNNPINNVPFYSPQHYQTQFDQPSPNPQNPDVQGPYGQFPYSQQPYNQFPYAPQHFGQMPYNQLPYAPQHFGQMPYGQFPYVQGPYGQYPYPKTNVEWKPSNTKGWLIIAVIAAVLGASIGSIIAKNIVASNQQTIVKEYFPSNPSNAKPTTIQEILSKVLPSVVAIQASSAGIQDAGTGMIITSNGEVLTNNHVVSGATTVTVSLYGQTAELPAKVLGTIPNKDLALIQIENKNNLPTVTLGSSTSLQQGDSVVAIGNALDLLGGPSVTSGIVSGLNRQMTAALDNSNKTETLTGLIQTDAPINPGNSGGPLVVSNGDVVGINTASASTSGSNAPAQNVGFAIAIDSVKPLLGNLRSGGSGGTSLPPSSTSKPFLGVEVETLTPSLAKAIGTSATYGDLIVSIVPGTPAAYSGLEVNDVIIAINTTKITNQNDLRNAILTHKPGDTIDTVVIRGSTEVNIVLTLSSTPG